MTTFQFAFDPPMTVTEHESLDEDSAAFPIGIWMLFVSPERCEVQSDLSAEEVEKEVRSLHRKHSLGRVFRVG